MEPAVPAGALYRIVGALDALAEMTAVMPSPMPSEEGVPLVNKVRGLGRAALEALDEERGVMLQRLLHPSFFEDGELMSFAARSSLGVLRGYLHGCLAEMQVAEQRRANALAYAEAKIREERGVGFTGTRHAD